MSFDVPVATNLSECFVKPGISRVLSGLSLAFEGATAILSTEDTVAEESDTVVFPEIISQVR